VSVREVERRLLQGIAGMTAATGAIQMVAPRPVLRTLRASEGPPARHLFGTVGMFMACTGGLLVARPDDRGAVAMTAAQKLGAAAAVSLGVRRGVFSPLALGVAGFDALSGALALDYWRRLG
jgi:hypothetical protein